MEQVWKFYDRSEWGCGPWDDEPIDKKVWKDAATGFDCMIHRNAGGSWCGYVGVPQGHKFFGDKHDKHYDLDCHGGLTFSDECHGMKEDGSGICHPADGGDHVWWFGFDCAHLNDVSPRYDSEREWHYMKYRTTAYVVEEVEGLAKQLA